MSAISLQTAGQVHNTQPTQLEYLLSSKNISPDQYNKLVNKTSIKPYNLTDRLFNFLIKGGPDKQEGLYKPEMKRKTFDELLEIISDIESLTVEEWDEIFTISFHTFSGAVHVRIRHLRAILELRKEYLSDQSVIQDFSKIALLVRAFIFDRPTCKKMLAIIMSVPCSSDRIKIIDIVMASSQEENFCSCCADIESDDEEEMKKEFKRRKGLIEKFMKDSKEFCALKQEFKPASDYFL